MNVPNRVALCAGRRTRRPLLVFLTLAGGLALAVLGVMAQTSSQVPPPPPPPPPAAAVAQNAPEISTQDATPTFSSRVNLVPVTVVVRDRQGHVIGNLTKDDFRLLDNGKPQTISRFSVEKPNAPVVMGQAEPDPDAPTPDIAKPETPPATTVIASRFLIYLFDDIHLGIDDLTRSRDAAIAELTTSMAPNERVAIYTSSGQNTLDFTDDRAKLQEDLLRLRPAPIHSVKVSECPPLNDYVAESISQHNDPSLMEQLVAETYACANMDPTTTPKTVVQQLVRMSAQQHMQVAEHDTRLALSVLHDAIRRLSSMPGQRTIIVASPGFLTGELQQDVTDLITRAIRANVVISALDARGLWTDPAINAAEHGISASVAPRLFSYSQNGASIQADILAEFASGTGGTFFHNSNDLKRGFSELAASPEFIYVLGFAPTSLKSDGSYHKLKVTLAGSRDLVLQTRRGYYAPKRAEDAAGLTRQELEDAAYSREIVQDFPAELHTQFFKPTEETAKLSVLARINIRQLRYRKEADRNCNTLRIFSLLFDSNGNYLDGMEKVLNIRLRDETLANKLGSGVTVRTVFDIKPGGYVIRLVVRDSEGQMMATANGAIQIP